MGVGIRDMKNHLSHYLARVREGESVTITDHGRPVARLAPLEGASVVEKLIAEGLATAPANAKRAAGTPVDIGATVSDLVAEQRR